MYEDKTTTMDLSDIEEVQSFQKTSNSIAEGYSTSAIWYKFTLSNDSGQDISYIIDFTERYVTVVDAYIVSDDGSFLHHRGGDSVSYEEKVIPSHTTRFPLSLKRDEEKTVYIRLLSSFPLSGTISVMTERSLATTDVFSGQLFGFYFGGLFSLLLYNLFIFFSTKDRVYLHYVLYVSSFMIFQLITTGFIPFEKSSGDLTYVIIVTSVPLTVIFFILFSRGILNTRKFTPRLDKVVQVIMWTMVPILIINQFEYYYSAMLTHGLLMILAPLLLYMAILTHLRGHKVAKFYIYAQSIFLITTMIFFLMIAGALPYNDFTRYGFLAGNLYEIILFSLALAYRIRSLEKEKQAIESVARERLEDQVYMKTKELRDIQKKIKQLNMHLQRQVHNEVEKNSRQQLMMMQHSRMAQMGEMLSMIAHQWRQPLTTINAATSTLKLKIMLDAYEADAFDKKLDNILEYTRHLNDTINDFRNFFKENKTTVETTLEQVVESTVLLTQPILIEKQIELVYDLSCNKRIKTHENELRQVILNLIKNSEDALTENTVSEPSIVFRTFTNANRAILEIRDNAGGIPEHDLEKVFDPYFTTKLQDGTGLGLYMSKMIIEDHCKGTLTVRNEDGGAVFSIKLPLEQAS